MATRGGAWRGRRQVSVVRCPRQRVRITVEAMMVSRRGVLITFGLVVALLWAPATAGAAQKAPKPHPVTVTLKVDGMT
jgi:hypothetical protein